MKKLFLLVAILTATMFSAKAVDLSTDLKAALPSGEFFLPAPPAPNSPDSLIWKDDSVKYFYYKDPSTTSEAYHWAYLNEQYYFALYRVAADSVMNAPFYDVTWTPNTHTVTSKTPNPDFPAINYLEQLCEQMKEENTSKLWRTRPRPYKYFGTTYKGKTYNIDKGDITSYPSGHGYFAGLFGMCLMYIDPENALKIKNMIDEWLHCRLILGAHWNSDLAAGQQLGAMAFAIAMNHSQFRDAVLAAKAELEAYRISQISANADPNHAGVYYSTFYDKSRKYQLPDGVSAYVAELNTDNLLLTKIADAGQVIPADNAVILKANAANFTLAKTDDEPVSFSAINNLQGVDEDGVDTPENCYVLSGGSTGVGFYQYAGATLAPHKAFVVISGSGSFAPALNFVFYDEQTTTDNGVITSQNPNGEWMKIFRDGQIIIERNGTQYSTPGQIIQ